MVRLDWVVDSVQVVCHEVVVVVPWTVATPFDFHSCCEDAVTKTPVVCVFHVHDALLEDEELGKFAEGATLCWGVAGDMHNCRLNVVQHKGARVAKEFGIAKLHLRSQSVEHLVDLEVVVKDGSAGDEVAHRDALREHVPVLHIDS